MRRKIRRRSHLPRPLGVVVVEGNLMPRFLLAIAITLILSLSAEAGIFSRKEKPNPAARVMELLNTLRNDPKANKRADAAEELREFDAQAFPEIVPGLIQALQHDSSSSVRIEAAQSLGKIRPTSQEVEQALEQASSQDDSMRVRFQARTARMGYRVKAPEGPAAPAANQPPVAKTPPSAAPVPPAPAPKPSQNISSLKPPTQPMPVAPPLERPGEIPVQPVKAAEETGPILDLRSAGPASLAKPIPAPKPRAEEEGPILVPPSRP